MLQGRDNVFVVLILEVYKLQCPFEKSTKKKDAKHFDWPLEY